MKISLLICTRNRAEQLRACLARLNEVIQPESPVEIVLVDNGSRDNTAAVIDSFLSSTKWDVSSIRAERQGLGHARNCGIRASSGDVIIFTDDDCYLEEKYFLNFLERFDPSSCQYGMGQILLYDPEDDARVANMRVEETVLIPPRSAVIPAGMVQGANMFFLRSVFEKAGLFNEEMGAGTQFPCEDIEMACRASHSGFSGKMLPGFTVYHHHGRKKNSPEASQTIRDYDFGRGAYYASLLARGVPNVWEFWQASFTQDKRITSVDSLDRLSRELAGASQYFELAVRRARAGGG